jgi:hypothetical protein
MTTYSLLFSFMQFFADSVLKVSVTLQSPTSLASGAKFYGVVGTVESRQSNEYQGSNDRAESKLRNVIDTVKSGSME